MKFKVVRGDKVRGGNPHTESQERPPGGPPQRVPMDVSSKPSRPSEAVAPEASPKRPRLLLDGPVEVQVDPRLEHLQWRPCCFLQGLLAFGTCMATQKGQRKQAGKSGSRRSGKQ